MADIGPCLPPNFSSSRTGESKQDKSISTGNIHERGEKDFNTDQKSKSDAKFYGPILPPSLQKQNNTCDIDTSNLEHGHGIHDESTSPESKSAKKYITDCKSIMIKPYGPTLPTRSTDSSSENSVYRCHSHRDSASAALIGPIFPDGQRSRTRENINKYQGSTIGPSPPDQDSDEDIVGPLPWQAVKNAEDSDIAMLRRQKIDERADAMKHKLTKKPEEPSAPKRESWMTELPPEIGLNIGVTARKFKTNSLSSSRGDRSVWTDTPADRAKKIKGGKTHSDEGAEKERLLSKKELEMQEQVERYNSQKRAKSLMEMHEDERKRQKLSHGASAKERQPFDRDRDLGMRKIDSKARATVVKQAKNLNTKFQMGKFESKFL